MGGQQVLLWYIRKEESCDYRVKIRELAEFRSSPNTLLFRLKLLVCIFVAPLFSYLLHHFLLFPLPLSLLTDQSYSLFVLISPSV